MAIRGDLKKMIVFSSNENRKLIENFMADESELVRKSQSALIEEHILNDILPKNSEAKQWVRKLYLREWTLMETLYYCFGSLTQGLNQMSLYNSDANADLVRYAMTLCEELDIKLNQKSDKYLYFKNIIFPKLIDKMKGSSKTGWHGIKESDIEYVTKISKILDQMPLYDLYNLILTYWDCFRGWSGTFSYLSTLACLHNKINDNARNRLRLVQVLKDVSQNWFDPERDRSK